MIPTILECIRYAIKSDPTEKDTDGDGYDDNKDPRPFKCDVTYYSIKDSKYVTIAGSDGTTYYGGRQNWFETKNWFSTDYILQNYGWGTIAASDLFLNFALQDNSYENTITDLSIKNNNIDQNDYMNYVRFLNEFYISTPRWTGVLGTSLSKAINSYFKYAKIDYKSSWPTSLTSEDMLLRIEEMLEKDIPVIFSVGPNTPNVFGVVEIEMYNQFKQGDSGYDAKINQLYQYKRIKVINGHYMTITEVIKDDISTNKNVMLKVSSWGKLFYIDFDEYREYVEDEGGKWTSSMVYIR